MPLLHPSHLAPLPKPSQAQSVPWWSIYPQIDYATIWPTQYIHPTNQSAVTVHPCDILTPVRSAQVFFVHPGYGLDSLSHVTWHPPPQNALWHQVHPFQKQNLDGLSHDFWTHLWYPAGCSVKCGHFVTGIFDTFVMFYRLSSEMWTFRRMISGHICDVLAAVRRDVNVLSQDFETHLWWRWWFLVTFVVTNQLLSETWTFCRTIIIRHICDYQLPVKGTVSWDFWYMLSIWKTK